MKRTLTIIAVFAVILGVAVAGFVYFSSRSAKIVATPTPVGSLPTAGQAVPVDPGFTDGTVPPPPPTTPASIIGRLTKISAGPVVRGEVVVDMPAQHASSSPEVVVHYIERQSGNVFSYLTQAGTITRTNNRTLPGIQSATWLPDASVAFVRYLSGTDYSTINTYALPASGSDGFFLPQNISSIAVASTSVLTLAISTNGSTASVGPVNAPNSGTPAFTSPLSSLRTSFSGPRHYLAFTKPSATLPGGAFLVDKTGHFSRVAGPLPGLVALASHSGTWVLVSYTRSGVLQLQLVNTTTRETLPLPLGTIADKCVWAADDSSIYCGVPVSPSADYAYPDDWYQGAVSFSDRIWKIDVAGRFAQLVFDFSKETSASLDAEALAINPTATILAFVNKNDGSLWSLRL